MLSACSSSNDAADDTSYSTSTGRGNAGSGTGSVVSGRSSDGGTVFAAETTAAAAMAVDESGPEVAAADRVATEQSATEGREAPYPTYPSYPEPAPDTRAAPPAPPAPSPSIQSRDAGVHPTENAEFDRFSTFAMDVDTSSYTLARGLVQGGTLPSFDSVRTEEFVNYFDQQYRSPDAGETFAVHVDGASVPFLGSDQRIMRVGIQAERIDRADRAPAHLTFVIDTSGSMEEDGKLRLVQDAIRKLVDNLRADDQIAIVEFSDTAHVVLGPTSADQRDRILGAVDGLFPTNSTNAEAGLQLGYELAERMRADDTGRGDGKRPAIHRVILASDGVANVGPNGPEQILGRIAAASRNGIDLVTVGVGTTSYNDEMMERLADGGNGFSAYVDAPFEAERLFRDRLVSTLQTVARDAKVQVEFNPAEVRSYRLIGYENRTVADSQFRDDSVDAGEIGAGHSVTALYEVTLRHPDAADRELATVRLRWDDVRKSKVRETSARVKAERISATLEGADPRLALDVAVATYADVLRRGTWSRLTSLRDLADRIDTVEQRLGGDVDVREFVDLVRRAASLSNGYR